MSIVFSIKNKKSLFGYQKVLAAQEVLKLVEGLTYSISFHLSFFLFIVSCTMS